MEHLPHKHTLIWLRSWLQTLNGFTKNHLKIYLDSLKECFSQWYDMCQGTSLSEFSWNANAQQVEATKEVSGNLINISVYFMF